MKDKYKDQDEEERKLKMELLASEGKKSTQSEKQPEKIIKQKKESKVNPSQSIAQSSHEPAQPSKQPLEQPSLEHPSLEQPSLEQLSLEQPSTEQSTAQPSSEQSLLPQPEPSSGQSQLESTEEITNKKAKESRRERRQKEKQEIKDILDEEPLDDLDEDEKEKLTELDSLTGNPLQDDVLMFAVPVCAPYNAMTNYKFKVKLTPGSAKRGKSVKSAMSVFLNLPGITQQEKDLLKGVTDNETNQTIIGNIKINVPLKYNKKKS